MKEKKNDLSVWIIFLVGILIIATCVVTVHFMKNINVIPNENINQNINTSENKKIEGDIKIISEDPSSGTPTMIKYNDNLYDVSSSDFYSIKYYDGELYYYKYYSGPISLGHNFQEQFSQEELESSTYEFGKITLNEENGTYNKIALKVIPFIDIDKEESIEYNPENRDGEYALEIIVD